MALKLQSIFKTGNQAMQNDFFFGRSSFLPAKAVVNTGFNKIRRTTFSVFKTILTFFKSTIENIFHLAKVYDVNFYGKKTVKTDKKRKTKLRKKVFLFFFQLSV